MPWGLPPPSPLTPFPIPVFCPQPHSRRFLRDASALSRVGGARCQVLKRHNKLMLMESESVKTIETKKLLQEGKGAFSMTGSSNALPYDPETMA